MGLGWGRDTAARPRPLRIAYFEMREGGTSGLFWRNDFAKAPVASDWFIEVYNGMTALIGK